MIEPLIERFPCIYEPEYLRVSTTQLGDWKRCRFKWWLKQRCRLEPKHAKRVKMEIGDYGHNLLAAWYKGEDLQEASQKIWDTLTKDAFEEEEEMYIGIRGLIEKVVERYIEEYTLDRGKFQVIAAEENAFASIPTNTGKASKILTQAKIDLVIEDERGLWFMEHKFTEDFKGREEDLPIDGQFKMYYWTVLNMFREQGLIVPLVGSFLNMVNPRLPNVPDVLKNGKSLSKDKRIFTTHDTYLKAIIDNGFNPDDYTEVLTELLTNPKPFFKRIQIYCPEIQLKRFEEELRLTAIDMINKRCIYRNANFMCKRDCSFLQLCILDMNGGDTKDLINTNFRVREVTK